MHVQVAEDDLNAINMALYIKDHYNLSGDAYHEMAQLFKSMPRHYKLKERISELNCLWDIQPTPVGTCGVQQSLESHLVPCVQQLVSCGVYVKMCLCNGYTMVAGIGKPTLNPRVWFSNDKSLTTMVCLLYILPHWLMCHSLVSRPSPPPVFDRLQYAKAW